ncbi:MAG TPA: nitroreductase family protein [Candidatus Lokiarchaeia archaeon]|nr:nitroreductase family protein [Candidatus Lokiarchaeia archaeon]
MMNETIQTILKRRSIRAYESTQLTDEELETIIEAGKYAPSGANSQSWHFSVIQKTDLIDRLNAIVREMYLHSDNPRMMQRAAEENFSVFYNAPTTIIISADESAITPQLDSALAMGNMFLAAASLGIGSCWINAMSRLFDREEGMSFKEELCMPDGYKVFAAGVFGYPSGDLPEPAPRKEGTVDIIK